MFYFMPKNPLDLGRQTMNDLEQFRAETRAWLEANAPASLYGTRQGRFDGYWGGKKSTETNPDVLRWRDVMLSKGWTAPMWPKAYGGAGLSRDEAEVLEDLLVELKLPPPVVGFGLTMIGPTLLDYGSEAQKLEHLPRICSGEIRWCQGYSEPNAGSDLASLQTRGVLEGDTFLINGQKVWTSHADKSDWIFCLVRTDPNAKKQQGISFILVDMQTEGVSTRPIELISGASPFCETFLENVRVPVANMVGELHRGWTVAKALLGYERSMIGSAITGQLASAELALVDQYRRSRETEGGVADPVLRDEIARFGILNECLDMTRQRIQQAQEAGAKPGSEASIMKVVGTTIKQARYELGMRVGGLDSVGWSGEGFHDQDLKETREYLRSRANSIEGGASEIQLNIIAKAVLGLPST